MANFAGYGFNKAHTVAYGLVSYQTAYFKAHYPLEFIAASMTMDRGQPDKLLKFKRELERLDASLFGPDVNVSRTDFRVEEQTVENEKIKGVRHALTAIKGAGEEAMKRVVDERDENGPYKDIFDFIERLGSEVVNRKQLEVLINAGAFDGLYKERDFLYNNIDILLGYNHTFSAEKNSDQIGLFGGASEVELERPTLVKGKAWDPFLRLEQEQKAIGFYLSSHPLNVYDEDLRYLSKLKDVASLQSLALGGIEEARIACIIHDVREVKTKRGDRMGILTISDSSGQDEVAMFPETYREYESAIETDKPLIMTLALSADGERVRMNVQTMGALDDALKKEAQVSIRVEDANTLSELKTLFEASGKGTTACQLHMTVRQVGTAIVRLPHPINLTKKLKHQLHALEGVSLYSNLN